MTTSQFETRRGTSEDRIRSCQKIASDIQVLCRIGTGGSGDVWQAWSKRDIPNGQCAVKFLNEKYVDSHSEREQFRNAFKIAKTLDHPQVCRIYSYDEHRRLGPWILMEYVDGVLLRDYMNDYRHRYGDFSPVDLIAILRSAAKPIDYLHQRGPDEPVVVHGDITPRNLVICRSSLDSVTVKLIDLGLTFIANTAMPITGGHTPGYASPEQSSGEKYGAASDRYSFAVIAYRLITGRMPFPSSGTSTDRPPDTMQSPQLTAIFQKALNYQPNQRFSTCAALVDAIQVALRNNKLIHGGNELLGDFGVQARFDGQRASHHEELMADTVNSQQTSATTMLEAAVLEYKKLETRKAKIQSQMHKLTRRRSELDGPIRLGILGLPTAGKSTLFACWYWYRNQAGLIDVVIDGPTRDHLAQLAEQLQSGGTNATPIAPPKLMELGVSAYGSSWQIEAMDFAGEFLTPANADAELLDQAKQARDFVGNCDVIYVIPQRDASDKQIADSLDQIVTSPRQTVILLLAKFDTYGFDGKNRADFGQFFHQLLRKEQSLRQIFTKLQRTVSTSGKLTVLPVSSKSLIGVGDEDTDSGEPFQVFYPLLYAARARKLAIMDVDSQLASTAEEFEEIRDSQRRLTPAWNRMNERLQQNYERASEKLNTSLETTPIDLAGLTQAQRTVARVLGEYSRRYQLSSELDDIRALADRATTLIETRHDLEFDRLKRRHGASDWWSRHIAVRKTLQAARDLEQRIEKDREQLATDVAGFKSKILWRKRAFLLGVLSAGAIAMVLVAVLT